MVATILILSLDELFPCGVRLGPFVCVPCSLLPQGSQPWGGVVQGASVWIPFACSPRENCSWLLSQPPFLWGGGGREREENSKKSTLLTCTAVTLCLLRYNSLAFIDNSSVYSCNSSFISFIYGDLDGWAGPLLAWGNFVPVETGGLETYSLSPFTSSTRIRPPGRRFNFGNSYSLASLTPTLYYLPWPPCIQWGNSV